MRYSTEPKYRKYVKGYGFLSFAKKFGNKYGKKLIDIATKTGTRGFFKHFLSLVNGVEKLNLN